MKCEAVGRSRAWRWGLHASHGATHTSSTAQNKLRAVEIRADKRVWREHLSDDSLLLPGLAERRVFSLGGEPAVALFRWAMS
jgi:hypothetical protein